MTITAARPVPTASTRVLLPYRHLEWRSIAVGSLGATAPGFVVIVLLGIERHHVLPLVGMASLIAAHAAAGVALGRGARVVLDRDGLLATRFTLRAKRIGRGRVRKAVIRSIGTPDGLDAYDHLFLLDAEGTAVYRVSDRWWQREHLTAIAKHFQVPIEVVPETLNRSELRRLPARQLHWYERTPFAAALLGAAAIGADCSIAAALAVIVLR